MDTLKLFIQILTGVSITAATYLAYPLYYRYIKNKRMPVPRRKAKKITFINTIINIIIYTIIGIILIDKLYAPNYVAAALWGNISYRIMKRGGSVYDYRSDQEIFNGVVNEKRGKKKTQIRENNNTYLKIIFNIYAKSFYQARAEVHSIAAQKASIKALKADQNGLDEVRETVSQPEAKEKHINQNTKTNTKNYKIMDEYEASIVKKPPNTGKNSKIPRIIAVIVFILLTAMAILGTINGEEARKGTTGQKVVKFPANGTVDYLTSADRKIPVWIKAPNGKYNKYYVIIKDYISKETLIRAYLASGETIQTKIPETDFEIYYATGNTWYGNKNLFEKDGEYNYINGYINVKNDKNKYNGYMIEIGKEPVEFKMRIDYSKYPRE